MITILAAIYRASPSSPLVRKLLIVAAIAGMVLLTIHSCDGGDAIGGGGGGGGIG